MPPTQSGCHHRPWFPAQLAGRGIEREQDAVGGGEVDHVLVDAEALVARRPWIDALRVFAGIFPDQIAIGGIDRLNRGAGREQIHDAAVDDRHRFLRAVRQTARPGHPQLADVAFVDLVERAEALLIERAVHHQPIARIGIGQRRLRHRNKALGEGTYGESAPRHRSAQHDCCDGARL
jgi:hypothetical protein